MKALGDTMKKCEEIIETLKKHRAMAKKDAQFWKESSERAREDIMRLLNLGLGNHAEVSRLLTEKEKYNGLQESQDQVVSVLTDCINLAEEI